MKRKTLFCLIIALCCLATTGCTLVSDMATEMYWSLDDPVPVDAKEVMDTLCIVKYSINQDLRQSVIHNQAGLDVFLYRILSNARNGDGIEMQSSTKDNRSYLSSFKEQETIKFSSPDINKVKEWAKKMLLKGYRVEIIYDKKHKIYNCTAGQPLSKPGTKK